MQMRLRALLLCVCAASIPAQSAPDLTTLAAPQIDQLAQTIGVSETEKRIIKQRLTDWQQLLTSAANRTRPDAEKLGLVNDFMYDTPFYCDAVMWCREDYWAKPVEFLANNGGDCEDFAIAKYFTLKALGVADDRLRIVYAVYRRGTFSGAHMVLAYYPTPDAEPLILDNINPDILPSSRRPDITPVFGFNSQGLWSAQEEKGRGKPTDAYRSWGEQWRRVQSDENLRSVSAAQRKAPECQALIAQSPWCR